MRIYSKTHARPDGGTVTHTNKQMVNYWACAEICTNRTCWPRWKWRKRRFRCNKESGFTSISSTQTILYGTIVVFILWDWGRRVYEEVELWCSHLRKSCRKAIIMQPFWDFVFRPELVFMWIGPKTRTTWNSLCATVWETLCILINVKKKYIASK